ncbi:hypothetical protein BJ508DRAFT_364532 [Ascobolus immersus RN42]|uniref:Uncharacterized protein n=1 Tax=Ascobolus immersus RN42 TaxID=1160509 RepID=A0A3N4HTY0_ASCIM|nr:hypothetical protein BJ508DRAFT_364532 [Ascobolus immersus RN42]
MTQTLSPQAGSTSSTSYHTLDTTKKWSKDGFYRMKQGVGFRVPLLICGLFLGGILSAIGHFFLFRFLHHRLPEDTISQVWASTLGIAFANITRACFGGALGIAYLQRVWFRFRKAPLRALTIESLMGLPTTPQKLLFPRLIRSATLEWIFALVCVLLPIATTFPPGSLTIVPHQLRSFTEEREVPTVYFGGVTKQSATLEDMRKASIARLEKDNRWSGHFFRNAIPKSDVEKLASEVFLGKRISSWEGPASQRNTGPNVGQGGQNSTYSLKFRGPRLKCEERPFNLTRTYNGYTGPDSGGNNSLPTGFYGIRHRSLVVDGTTERNLEGREVIGDVDSNSTYRSVPILDSRTDYQLFAGDNAWWNVGWQYMSLINQPDYARTGHPFCHDWHFFGDRNRPYMSSFTWFRKECHNCYAITAGGRAVATDGPNKTTHSNLTLIHCTPGVAEHVLDITYTNGAQTVNHRTTEESFEPTTIDSIREIFSRFVYQELTEGTEIDLTDNKTVVLRQGLEGRDCEFKDGEKAWMNLTGVQIKGSYLHMQALTVQNALFQLLEGNITWYGDHVYRLVTAKKFLESPFAILDNDNPGWLDINLTPQILEEVMNNITISLIGLNRWSEKTMVEFTPWGNVYNFDPWRLLIPYISVFVVSLVLCALGLHALLSNGFAATGGFLQIVESTVESKILHEVAKDSAVSVGSDPSKELEDLRLVLGEVVRDVSEEEGDGDVVEKDLGSRNVHSTAYSSSVEAGRTAMKRVWAFQTEEELQRSRSG